MQEIGLVRPGWCTCGRLRGRARGRAGSPSPFPRHPGNQLSRRLPLRTYDTLARLTTTRFFASSYSLLASYSYTYDAAGQRDTETTADTTRTYAYDAWRQLVGDTPAAATAHRPAYEFAFDPIGNRITATNDDGATARTTAYTANTVNQYASILMPGSTTPEAPAYDANGNTTALSGQTLVYDEDAARQREEGDASLAMQPEATAEGEAERAPAGCEASQNRLVQVTTATEEAYYTYDALGRRVEKLTYANGSPTGLVRYVYDGWRVVEELDEAFATTRSYTLGLDLSGSLEGAGGIGGLLALSRPSGLLAAYTTANYFYDGNGNVTDLAFDDGTPAARYAYGPFGERLSATGPWADINIYQFSSKPRETINGFYYYGFRYYDPQTGRWPSRDPIEEGDGPNMYAFVHNNPQFYVDRDGRDSLGLWDRPPNTNPLGQPILESSSGPSLLDKALEAVVNKAFLRCYLLDLTKEDLDEINRVLEQEISVLDAEIVRDYFSDIPQNAALKFLAINTAVRSLTVKFAQGTPGKLVPNPYNLAGKLLNRERILVPLRKKVRDMSIRLVGRGGMKVWGRVGSKILPLVGWFSLGYEAAKACHCQSVTEDGEFTNNEKFIGQ